MSMSLCCLTAILATTGAIPVGDPPPGCVRWYDRSLWGTRKSQCLRSSMMQAISKEHQRTGCVASHAKRAGSVCNLSLAEEIGVFPDRRMWLSARERRQFLRRLDRVRHLSLGSPTLSFGGSLRGSDPANAECDGPMHCGVHFWGQYWVDASIYAHFFARGTGGKPVRDGVYVDIGGQTGVDGSNTLFFEQHLGWTGIVIEPTACGTCVIPHTRPRDRVVHAAACASSTVIEGSAFSGSAMNFCAAPYDSCVAKAPGGYSNYSTPCEPMRRLLLDGEGRLPPRIDFFSVDVEHHVMTVLQTIPFNEIDIDVLLVEAKRGTANPPFNHEREAIALLRANGYDILPCTFTGDLVAVKRACVHD